jgi:hypothetical protein
MVTRLLVFNQQQALRCSRERTGHALVLSRTCGCSADVAPLFSPDALLEK